MHRRMHPLTAGFLFLVLPTLAGDPPTKDKKDAKDITSLKKPATVKVEKGPLAVVVHLKAITTDEEATELRVRFKSWSGPLLVRQSIEHGTAVKAGDVLVEFDAEKFDHVLRDARQDREIADLAIRQAELELPILEKQAPLDLAAAERSHRQASDDLKRFLTIDRPLEEEDAVFTRKSSAYYWEQAKDELKQLEKMYRDKDLTEETEQVILKRYRYMVEMSEQSFKRTRIRTEYTLKFAIPRKEQAMKDAAAKEEIVLTRARDVQPLVLKQKQLALAKMRFDQAKSKEHLAELEQDRAMMTVKAPCDGLVYHGRALRGRWMTPPEDALAVGGMIPPGMAFLSVVPRRKLMLRAEAEEKELPGLTPGLAGRLAPTAFPDEKLNVKIDRVGGAPLNGKFDVFVVLDGDAKKLVPGMTGSLRFVTVRKADALTVPASAVFEDEIDESRYVHRPGKSGKQVVKVGIRSGDRLEIIEGLREGDEISASKP